MEISHKHSLPPAGGASRFRAHSHSESSSERTLRTEDPARIDRSSAARLHGAPLPNGRLVRGFANVGVPHRNNRRPPQQTTVRALMTIAKFSLSFARRAPEFSFISQLRRILAFPFIATKHYILSFDLKSRDFMLPRVQFRSRKPHHLASPNEGLRKSPTTQQFQDSEESKIRSEWRCKL